MDRIPYSAIGITFSLLIIIWFFLLHMILSRSPDAHLQILLNLMSANKEEWL